MKTYELLEHCAHKDCHAMLDFTEISNNDRSETFMVAIWNLFGWKEGRFSFWYCPEHDD